MEFLPFKPKSAETPVNVTTQGRELDVPVNPIPPHCSLSDFIDNLNRVFAVYLFYGRKSLLVRINHLINSNLPRGGPLERGLRRVIRDVALGSLLIQTEPKSGEPLLLHSMLPNCIKFRHLAEKSWVLLLDAQVKPSIPQ